MSIFNMQNRIELAFYTAFNNHINLTYMSTSTNVANIPVWQNLSLENLPNEIWKPIFGYEELYEISNLGRVKSKKRLVNGSRGVYYTKNRILKQSFNSSGYLRISLYKSSKEKTKSIHRLLAKAFCENPNNYNVVNHIDNNQQNNNYRNLEWVTARYNSTCHRIGKTSNSIGVHFCNREKKYISRVYHNGKSIYLGGFNTDLEAKNAYQNYLKKHRLGMSIEQMFELEKDVA